MIEGITILSTVHKVVRCWAWTQASTNFFLIALFGLGLMVSCATLVDWDYHDFIGPVFSTIGGAMFLICGIASLVRASDAGIAQEYDVYKVTIDNSVSMNEFMENWKIISVEGQIYEIAPIDAPETEESAEK